MKTIEAQKPQDKDNVQVFLPPEALIGEQVPSFALWPNKRVFDRVEVTIPSELNLLDVYNAEQGNWSLQGKTLTVNKVELNGYLGMLLVSETSSISEHPSMEFVFISSSSKHKVTKSIHLYRPVLAVHAEQDGKPVNIDKLESPIVLQKKGLGTVYVEAETGEDSEIQLQEPIEISDFTKQFREDIKSGFRDIRVTYTARAPYLSVLGEIETLLLDPPKMKAQHELDKFKQTVQDFQRLVAEDKQFGQTVGEVISSSFLKNLHMYNILQQMSEYVHSVGPMKVILRNPLAILAIGPAPRRLTLKIEYTDLTYSVYPPQSVSLRLSSGKPRELPLHKLFRWEST